MIVQFVDPRSIVNIWNQVKPYIEKALEHTDDYNADQVKVFLTNGSWNLFIVIEDNVLHGVATVAVENGVNHKTAMITTISGKGIINKDAMEQLINILKASGMTRIQGYARDSLVRLYQRFGLEKKANLVEFKL
jgi:hypothetical protein